MLHGHFDETFLLSQEYIVGSRVGIQGLRGPTNCYYNSVTTTPLAERIFGTVFV